jgi:diguanylate cyclase (GGDEF)-like protein/PAS domain S-box-containing protein
MVRYAEITANMPDNPRFWQFLLRPVSTWRRLISERRVLHRQMLRLQDNEAFLYNLIHSIPDLIWLKNPDGVYLACNPAFERFFGAGQAQIIGKTDYDFIDPEQADSFRAHDQAAIAAERALVNEEWITFAVDGKHVLVETTKVAMRTERGDLIGVLGIARDITERKRLEAELLEMATTDFLTGLANRRHFIARMEEELARINRIEQPVAVLMLDIDHFKRINDRYGHASGDAVLRRFAELIREELRAVDSAGRVGGEEFAILLAGTDLAGAAVFAERLRGKIARSPVAQGDEQIPVTVSIGITALTSQDADTSDVLQRADAALYDAKENGRNRVAIAGAPH